MQGNQRKEGGFILVVVAILLIVLIGFVALGVDSGVLYSARTTAQESADAAALAGAFTFVVEPTSPQPATAIAHAKAVATQSSVFGTPIPAANVTVVPDIANKRVQVTIQLAKATYFAKALGIGSATIVVNSLAEAGAHSTNVTNPKPFFLPNTIADDVNDPCAACMAGHVLVDPGTGDVTAYGKAAIGKQLSIKPTDPKDALEPSLFFLIDFTDGGGGSSELSGWIDGSIPTPLESCGNLIEVEKGNKVGLKHGIDDLLGDPPNDTYVAVGQYAINHGAISDSSKALVTVPIWDTCGSGFCAGGLPPGHPKLKILGWALVFLEGMVGSGKNDPLVGRLINISGCAPGGATGAGSGVIGGFPLRLVR